MSEYRTKPSTLETRMELHGIALMQDIPEGWEIVDTDVPVQQLLSPLGDKVIDEIMGYEARKRHFDEEYGKDGWAACVVRSEDGTRVYQHVVDIIAPMKPVDPPGAKRLGNGALLYLVSNT